MRILKVIAFPTYLLLSFFVSALTFLAYVATRISTLFSGVCILCAVLSFIVLDRSVAISSGVPCLIATFLFSELDYQLSLFG